MLSARMFITYVIRITLFLKVTSSQAQSDVSHLRYAQAGAGYWALGAGQPHSLGAGLAQEGPPELLVPQGSAMQGAMQQPLLCNVLQEKCAWQPGLSPEQTDLPTPWPHYRP